MTLEEIIARTIFHSLREKLVVDGYLPDITLFDIDNADIGIARAALKDFDDAKGVIAADKGFCIEVFPFSSNQSKGYKKTPRIVVDIHEFLPSNIGTDPTPYYEKVGDYFVRKKPVSLLSEMIFTVYAIASDSNQMYVMNDIIMTVLPIRGYIKRYTDTELRPYNNLFIELIDKFRRNDLEEGIMERSLRYEIPDLQEISEFVIENPISPIKVIDLDVEPKKL